MADEQHCRGKLIAYTIVVRFEWDPDKAAQNERLHGVSFEEACELFTTDLPVLEVYDVDHSETEDRFKSIGPI
jgi:hypothetical protein